MDPFYIGLLAGTAFGWFVWMIVDNVMDRCRRKEVVHKEKHEDMKNRYNELRARMLQIEQDNNRLANRIYILEHPVNVPEA